MLSCAEFQKWCMLAAINTGRERIYCFFSWACLLHNVGLLFFLTPNCPNLRRLLVWQKRRKRLDVAADIVSLPLSPCPIFTREQEYMSAWAQKPLLL